jgi:hypothetical protein
MKEKINKKLEDLKKRREGMKQYLLLKYGEEDWHGCMDAAADIREIDAEMKCLEHLKDDLK